jgi:hypothetical protein
MSQWRRFNKGVGGAREVSGGEYKGDKYIRHTGVDLKIAPDSPHLVVGKRFPHVGSQEDNDSDVLSQHVAALAHSPPDKKDKNNVCPPAWFPLTADFGLSHCPCNCDPCI